MPKRLRQYPDLKIDSGINYKGRPVEEFFNDEDEGGVDPVEEAEEDDEYEEEYEPAPPPKRQRQNNGPTGISDDTAMNILNMLNSGRIPQAPQNPNMRMARPPQPGMPGQRGPIPDQNALMDAVLGGQQVQPAQPVEPSKPLMERTGIKLFLSPMGQKFFTELLYSFLK